MLLVYRRPFNWLQADSLVWWCIGTKCDIWFIIRGQFTCHWPVNPGGHRHWAKRCWSTQVAPSAQLCPRHHFTTETYTGSVTVIAKIDQHTVLWNIHNGFILATSENGQNLIMWHIHNVVLLATSPADQFLILWNMHNFFKFFCH